MKILSLCFVFSIIAFGCSAKPAQTTASAATTDSNAQSTAASTAVQTSAAQQSRTDLSSALSSLGFYVYDQPIDLPITAPISALKGEPVKVSDFTGKITLLNFWATWCPPCRAEMPSIERLYQQMSGTNFRIVAVDAGEQRAQVASFIKKISIHSPSIWMNRMPYRPSLRRAVSLPPIWLIKKERLSPRVSVRWSMTKRN